MPLKQWSKRILDHWTGEVLNRCSQNDSQLAIPVLKSYLFDLLGIKKGLEVDDPRICTFHRLTSPKQECSRTIGANGVSDYSFECVVHVVARRADFDCEHKRLTTGVHPHE